MVGAARSSRKSRQNNITVYLAYTSILVVKYILCCEDFSQINFYLDVIKLFPPANHSIYKSTLYCTTNGKIKTTFLQK